MPKNLLRQKLLKQRQRIDGSDCLRRSDVIQQALLNRPEYQDAELLALYAPIRNEVQTSALFSAARKVGKRVCFPRVQGDSLEFFEVDDCSALKPGSFGIAEPLDGKPVSVAAIDLMVVPGVGFDRLGYRLGYGRGYYDRLVNSGRPAVMAGLAYEIQIVEELPKEDHDVRLDLLVTDNGIIKIER
ncbi:MAG: 5-formyltetrahydrofolate cyclo-ligase [Desulfuromonas sp.]|nr:MAG: 5-formyltetrahydrofolate cyclo-ligase [Desulfuromonas sp.]